MKKVKRFSLAIATVGLSLVVSAQSLAESNTGLSVINELATVDTRELSSQEHASFIKQLDSLGSIPMNRLSDYSKVSIKPGSMSAEEGLDFIPDDNEAIDIYLSLLEEGTIPFVAVFITNSVLFN